MSKASIVVVSSGVSQPSSTRLLADRLAQAVSDELAARGHHVVIVAPSQSSALVRESRRAIRAARSDPSAAGAEGLTPSEQEVLALVAEGLSNADVAERLYISPRTAAVHVSNILAKLGASSRTEAAAWAMRQRT